MKGIERLWTVITVLLLFAVFAAPIQASDPITGEPDLAGRIDNRLDPFTEA